MLALTIYCKDCKRLASNHPVAFGEDICPANDCGAIIFSMAKLAMLSSVDQQKNVTVLMAGDHLFFTKNLSLAFEYIH